MKELTNIDQAEKDKLLACIEIVSAKLRRDEKVIADLVQILRNKIHEEAISQKITGEVFNKCYYSIDEATVQLVFYEGQFMEPDFNEDLLENAAIDYSSFKLFSPQEFQISQETQLLFMKLEKAREDYIHKAKSKNEQSRNEFRIFGYSLKDIPLSVNLAASFIILVVFLGSMLYFLKQVMKNDNKKSCWKKEAKVNIFWFVEYNKKD